MVKFEAGQQIFEDRPFVHVLTTTERGKRCNYCFKPSPQLKRCARCKVMFYCDKTCQAKDWYCGHKLGECLLYAIDVEKFNGHLINFDVLRLLLRLTLILERKPEEASKSYAINLNDGSPRTFNSLIDHRENLEKSENRMLAFVEICRLYDECGLQLDPDQLLSNFDKLLMNVFAIYDDTFNVHGKGVFIGAMQFNHSCKPNAVTVFEGTTLKIRALTDIDTDLQPVSIAYIDICKPTEQRREILSKRYYFNCECSRCLEGADIDPDYELYIAMFIKLTAEKDWPAADEVGQALLPIYEKYFQCQYPDLTVHLMQMLQVRRNLGFTLVDEITAEINEKLETALLITHGPNHSYYKNTYHEVLADLELNNVQLYQNFVPNSDR